MERTYIYEKDRRGLRYRAIVHKEAGEDDGSAAVALPKGLPDEVYSDVLTAVRSAYQLGRQDRSAELIPSRMPSSMPRAILLSAITDAIRTWAPGWLPPEMGDPQYRITLDKYDPADHAFWLSIGNAFTFPLRRYRLMMLVEELGQ